MIGKTFLRSLRNFFTDSLLDGEKIRKAKNAKKPNAAFYEPLISRSGFAPEEIFFTDDRIDNIEGAKAVGIQAFHFTGAEKLKSDLIASGIPL